jgi:hypothetical protein
VVGRVDDGDPDLGHQVVEVAPAQHRGGVGELGAVVDPGDDSSSSATTGGDRWPSAVRIPTTSVR